MQLTIREITRQATSPKFWAGLLCIVCILTVSAPFSTGEQFNTVQLFIYWGGIAVSTYFCTEFVLLFILKSLIKAGKTLMTARVTASLAAAFSAAMVVLFINTTVIGAEGAHWKAIVWLSINCMLIALAIIIISFIASDTPNGEETIVHSAETSKVEQHSNAAEATSTFHERLSKPLGTDVISLQAQDHYVDVRTTLGNELVLIRLADAIKELGEENGIQVHRSWWVTHKHMIEQKRINGKPHVVLSNNSVVPVSRTYSAAVKTALTQTL